MQSMPITTEVVSTNSANVKCKSMQYYIIIVGGFLLVLRFPPHNNIESHDIAEILLKVEYGIYIYICTHCHSVFRLWVWFSYMVRCTRYIWYYEAILITVVLEFFPLFWYVAHEKRENHLNSDLILFRLIIMLNSELHRYQVGSFFLYQSCVRPSKLTVVISKQSCCNWI
jgi:hypothetical protein